ncbi:MAG: MFS transporter [Betaproteobacteria bacterium]|nr:MFS transporter [Betaproteobacteria bacterium]
MPNSSPRGTAGTGAAPAAPSGDGVPAEKSKARMPFSVYLLGMVSMLNDIATEMVTPLIPILLATVLVSGPVVLGLVEGLASAVACVMQIWAGKFSDASGGWRKPLAIGGYLISNVVRPVLGFATAWWHVVLIRACDRVGKGIRNAPRDALIVDLAPPAMRARAFGIHRAFDNLGAVGGALLGALVISVYSTNLKDVLLISAIPGLLCVALFAFGVKEAKKPAAPVAMTFSLRWGDVPGHARGYLLTVMLFTFARTAEVFIVLRAHELGASTVHALLLWAALHFCKIFANYGAGVWADRNGRFSLLIPGWLLHSLAMLGFCLVTDIASLWMAALFFGFAMSVSEGVERAVIGDFAEARARGTLFGWYYALVGIASIPAGLLLGWLWQSYGAAAAYGFAGIAGLAATAWLHFKVAPAIASSLAAHSRH